MPMAEQQADAEADQDGGHDQAGDGEVEQRLGTPETAAEREPASSEITTVSAMTMSASMIERVSEPPKSPTACAGTALANQCVETPRIGKVRPPSGPWNDRIDDGDGRAVEEQHEQREERSSEQGGAGRMLLTAPAGCRRRAGWPRPSAGRSPAGSPHVPRRPGIAAAPISFAIISPTEALWPPLMRRTVTKSPITSVTTKMVPMAMPGLHSGMITLRRSARRRRRHRAPPRSGCGRSASWC